MDGMYSDKAADYFSRSRTEIAPLLPDSALRVLEIGCGAGATMRWLRQQRDIQYAAGMEVDPRSAAAAADTFDVVVTGNAETTGIPDEGFDLIIILDVLEHLMDPWAMIRRLHSVLAPGGAIIASIPNVGHYSVALPLLSGKWEYDASGLLDRTHLRFFTKRTAIDLMCHQGLAVQKVDRVRLAPPGMSWATPKMRWYVTRLLALAVPDHLLAYQFLIRSVRTD